MRRGALTRRASLGVCAALAAALVAGAHPAPAAGNGRKTTKYRKAETAARTLVRDLRKQAEAGYRLFELKVERLALRVGTDDLSADAGMSAIVGTAGWFLAELANDAEVAANRLAIRTRARLKKAADDARIAPLLPGFLGAKPCGRPSVPSALRDELQRHVDRFAERARRVLRSEGIRTAFRDRARFVSVLVFAPRVPARAPDPGAETMDADADPAAPPLQPLVVAALSKLPAGGEPDDGTASAMTQLFVAGVAATGSQVDVEMQFVPQQQASALPLTGGESGAGLWQTQLDGSALTTGRVHRLSVRHTGAQTGSLQLDIGIR